MEEMTQLLPPLVFQNGINLVLKKNAENVIFICLSGGPIEPLLAAAQVPSLDLPSDMNDLERLQRSLTLAGQVIAAYS